MLNISGDPFVPSVPPWHSLQLIKRFQNKHIYLFIVFVSFYSVLFSQDYNAYKWFNPSQSAFPVIEGQGWPDELKSTYNRFPSRAMELVRPKVWELSQNSAGLSIRFQSDASAFVVRYIVREPFAMNHMPATGVSGVDLYATDLNGNQLWVQGAFTFGDTIEYRYSNVEIDPSGKGRHYTFQLYFPLYNTVSWMEIGVPENNHFEALPIRKEKPIVLYGTSIGQGGCATRPGLAWSSILERKLDRPLINLAFSGNGQLEDSVVELITEIDARMYILDCLANLSAPSRFPPEEVVKRIRNSVMKLQKKRPGISILLVAVSNGRNSGIMDTSRQKVYENMNTLLEKTFAELQKEGIKNIHILRKEEIGLDKDGTVDGVHPNDIGMKQYADAYEKKIRSILKEPVGNIITTIPVRQSRDGSYNWDKRHASFLELKKLNSYGTVILANSIIHYWAGQPKPPIVRGEQSWNRYIAPLNTINAGYGWDKIQNVLWRVYHDELDGFTAKNVVLMIGVNNVGENTDDEIITGLSFLLDAVRERQPEANLFISAILPWKNHEQRIVRLNKKISQLASRKKIRFFDATSLLALKDGSINETLFSDGIHPNEKGYEILGKYVGSVISKE